MSFFGVRAKELTMLTALHLKDVGPAPQLDITFAERLNIFTGDNGLGKTFLLDIVWWVLTQTWPEMPAQPRRDEAGKPEIGYQLSDHTGKRLPNGKSTFNGKSMFHRQAQRWPRSRSQPPTPGLVVYVRVDGGFSVWDPARNLRPIASAGYNAQTDPPQAYHFTSDTLWNGLEYQQQVLCNGLIRDWVKWQFSPPSTQPEIEPFTALTSVLQHLSPHPGERIDIGQPVRVIARAVRQQGNT
jgi:hypothetical protein